MHDLNFEMCYVYHCYGVYPAQFEKPGRRPDFDYPEMSFEAVSKALEDARVTYQQVEQAAVGYVYGEDKMIINNITTEGSQVVRIFNAQ